MSEACSICGRSDKPACKSDIEADECIRRVMEDQFGTPRDTLEAADDAFIARILATPDDEIIAGTSSNDLARLIAERDAACKAWVQR